MGDGDRNAPAPAPAEDEDGRERPGKALPERCHLLSADGDVEAAGTGDEGVDSTVPHFDGLCGCERGTVIRPGTLLPLDGDEDAAASRSFASFKRCPTMPLPWSLVRLGVGWRSELARCS